MHFAAQRDGWDGPIPPERINYRIEMKVPGARVAHVLRMPTAKEMQGHERALTRAFGPACPGNLIEEAFDTPS